MSLLTQMNQTQTIYTGPNGQQFTNNTNIPKELVIFAIYCSAQYDGKPTTKDFLSVSDFMIPMRKLIYKIQNPASSSLDPIDVSTIMKSSKGTAMHSVLEEALKWYGGYTQEVRSEKVFNGVTIHGKFDLIDNETNTIKDLKNVSNYAYKKLLDDIKLLDTMDNSYTLKEKFQVIPNYTKYQFQLSAYRWLNQDLNLNPWGDIIFSLNDGGGMDRFPIDNFHRFPLLPFEELEEFFTEHLTELHEHIANGTLPDCSPAERGYIPPEYKLQRVSPTNGSMTTVRGSKFDNESEFRDFIRKSGKPGDQEVISPSKYILCTYCQFSSICDQPV